MSNSISKDPQEALRFFGLNTFSTPKEFKTAFRKLVKDCHPDLFPGDTIRGERFLEVNHYGDIVKSFFELKPNIESKIQSERGHEFYIEVSLGSLLRGVELIDFNATCRECGGEAVLEDEECPDCHGAGGKLVSLGGYSTQAICETCSGSGYKKSVCPICSNGVRLFQKLTIPPGTKPGHIFCIDGDYVEVILSRDKKSKHFCIVGNDLMKDVLVPYTYMIFGGSKKVLLPSGEVVRLDIPPFSRCGSTIRVPGYGFRDNGNTKPGDFVAALFVDIPNQDMVNTFFTKRHLKALAKLGM